jgi:hypothetical protein
MAYKVAHSSGWYAAEWAIGTGFNEATEVAILRDVFGPLPFRNVAVAPSALAWNDGTVVQIARGIYEQQAFERMPLLADALQDAGSDDEVVSHCREERGHVRGCWIIDLLLNRD